MIASRISRADVRFGPTRFSGSNSLMIGSGINLEHPRQALGAPSDALHPAPRLGRRSPPRRPPYLQRVSSPLTRPCLWDLTTGPPRPYKGSHADGHGSLRSLDSARKLAPLGMTEGEEVA